MEIKNKILLNLLFPFLVLSANAQNPQLYTLNFSDWPTDVVENMKKEIPALSAKGLTEEQINQVIKTLDQKFKFNNLRVLKNANSNDLFLAGDITPQVERIDIKGLEELTESDALLLMNLTVKNAIDEDHLKSSLEKLTQHYQELGYRFATAQYEYKTVTTLKKQVLITVDTKKQTQLTDIIIENLDPQTTLEISTRLNWEFRKAVLNQETLNKVSVRLRKMLSENGYYLTQVSSPRLTFSADELKAKATFSLEKKQRYSVEIINVHQMNKPVIADEVLKLNSYFATDTNIGSDLAEKVKEYYRSEGYPHINVPYYERREGDKIIVTLNLEEGPFTKIKNVQILGQLSRDQKYYVKKFYELASSKVQSKIYVKEDIEVAAKNLLVEIQNEGFVNARLGLVQVSTDREKPKDGLVTIQLYEGEQVEISSIEFSGNQRIPTELLLEEMELKSGQRLNLRELELAINRLKVYYTNLGFIEFKLLNERNNLIQYTNKNSLAQLRFQIEEGPRVEVQSILIEGNEITHERVILTEIDFKPGDILTPAKLEESISRLQRTGHFGTIEIGMLEANSPIAARTIIIKVAERDPGVLTAGAGLTNENNGTFHAYTGLAYRNVGGWGRGFSLRYEGNYNYADVKFREDKWTGGYVEPYLFGTRTRFRINGTRSKEISNFSLRKVTELNSATFSLEQDFTSHITGIWEIPTVATYIDRGITVADEIENGYQREDLVIGSTGFTLDVDYRDNIFNPTKGSYSRFNMEYAYEFLGSNKVDDYFRATAQTTLYFPFAKSQFVFAQSFRGGYVADVNPAGFGVPFDKKGFVLGGRTTIRGFESADTFPTVAEIGPSFKLMSYSTYELIKSELRFPLVRKWDLMGAVFYDGGQVQISGFQFEDRWRDAVGVGLRYNTPIGPLNLEYAKKLDKKSTEKSGEAFHLSIGVF